MDPVSAIGIASAVVQFLDLGFKVAKKLAEYNAAGESEVPRSLQNISAQLPLLLDALARIKTDKEVGKFGVDTRCIIRGVVSGCTKLVEETEDIVSKAARQPGESFAVKLKKVLGSLKQDQKIVTIDRSLQTYIQVLILHHVVDGSAVQSGPSEEVTYFDVREKYADPFVERRDLIEQLDKGFYDAARSQSTIPTFVILHGETGAGKSQLALSYVRQAYELGQFPTVFWLNASNPESLKVSLESAAAIVRRSSEGTRTEKLNFLEKFLTERWHPWLLVLDGYNHIAYGKHSVRKILPDQGYGAILITTRDLASTSLGHVIEVSRYLTQEEEEDLRHQVSQGLEKRDVEKIKSALAKGISANQRETRMEWTFLARAALYGFEAAVEVLLAHGADIHLNPQRASPLAWAASDGNQNVVKRLLDHEDLIKRRLANEEYDRAAMNAMEKGHTDALELLFTRRNVNLRAKDQYNRTGFEYATKNGNLKLARFLFVHGAGPVSESERGICLAGSVKKGASEMIHFVLKEMCLDPDGCDDYGNPALCCATSLSVNDVAPTDGSEERTIENLVNLLLSAGATPNVASKSDGDTPLHEASIRDYKAIMSALLAHGAILEAKNKDGFTPLLSAAKYKTPSAFPVLLEAKLNDPSKRTEYFTGALQYAARNGIRDLALPILKMENGGDINAKDWRGYPLLSLAIVNGHAQVARLIARFGPDQSIPDNDGNLAMHLAAKKGFDLVLRDLVRAKNRPVLDVKDKDESTPLILAAQAGHELCVKVMLDAGADKDDMNKFGETALDIAEEKRSEKVIKVLEGLELDK
ncbi:MAG: hypothetical protein MMC23_002740 [Stictis urceolatum]|nr:hypothetical protein [Stictis urceolata]